MIVLLNFRRVYLPGICITFKSLCLISPLYFSGHYAYFVSDSRLYYNLESPQITTRGGCVRFYYNMEGGASAQLMVNVKTRYGLSTSRVFYANGIFIEPDEWKEGSFQIPAGDVYVQFSGYGDSFDHAPATIAIDDVEVLEGQMCNISSKLLNPRNKNVYTNVFFLSTILCKN